MVLDKMTTPPLPEKIQTLHGIIEDLKEQLEKAGESLRGAWGRIAELEKRLGVAPNASNLSEAEPLAKDGGSTLPSHDKTYPLSATVDPTVTAEDLRKSMGADGVPICVGGIASGNEVPNARTVYVPVTSGSAAIMARAALGEHRYVGLAAQAPSADGEKR